MTPKNIKLSDYFYELPDARIPKFPAEKRNDSKLLIFNDIITHSYFHNIPKYIQKDDILFLNNSKVMPARLLVKKTTGAGIEILLLKPAFGEIPQIALSSTGETTWEAMIGNLKKWRIGEELHVDLGSIVLGITLEQKNPNIVRFRWSGEFLFAEIIEKIGRIPIPPYLNRDDDERDKERYQTVYAEAGGSVAAPTAGLHFTKEILGELESKGVLLNYLTLHVGAGTFLPVKSADVFDHEMHFEMIEIELETLKNIKSAGRKIAVGTTSLRMLESIYWIGHQSLVHKKYVNVLTKQYPYTASEEISLESAVDCLIAEMERRNTTKLYAQTQLFILPGYEFMIVSVLITNFHQPNSTLLMLVDAFTGNWKKIYREALDNNYRFLSYGDSSILHRKNT